MSSVYYFFVKHAVMYCEQCVLLFCIPCCHCIVNSVYYCFVKHAVILLWAVCIIVLWNLPCVLCINSIIVFNSRMSLCWTARCPCFVLVHYNVIVLYKSSLLLHTCTLYPLSMVYMVLRPCMYLYSKTTNTFTFEWLSAFVILSKVPQSIIEVVS